MISTRDNTFLFISQFSGDKTRIAKSKMKQDRQLHVKLIGIDLSGPSNTKESTLVSFEARNNSLQMTTEIEGVTDLSIYDAIAENSANVNVIVGIDAPLSYNPGGGDRKSDKDLRKQIIAKGMHPGSVMPPTLNRMAYLTLRGISEDCQDRS